MNAYLAILAAGALISAVSAGFILAQSPRQRSAQIGALLPLAAAWWATCELVWNTTTDPQTVALWQRCSALTWVFIGALIGHLVGRFVDEYQHPQRSDHAKRVLERWRTTVGRATAVGYVSGGATLVCAWITPWVFGDPYAVPWGWNYVPGPLMLLFYMVNFTISIVSFAAVVVFYRFSVATSENFRRPWILIVVTLPLFGIAITEFILPMNGIDFPRLGSVSFAVMTPAIVWTLVHYGMTATSEVFASEVLEQLHDGLLLVNRAGVVRSANPSFAKLYGQSQDRLLGVPVSELIGIPLDANTEIIDTRHDLSNSIGETIPVSISTIFSKDRRGKPMSLIVVVRDLREVEDLRKTMIQQARLAGVGELAAGIAHEINNPIAFVRSNLTLLENHWKQLCNEADFGDRSDELESIAREGMELLAESLDGVQRTADIVRGVRRFTHSGSEARELANIARLLDSAASMARPQFASGVTMERDYVTVPDIECAPQELRQVFLNLIVNASQAVGNSGNIRLLTRSSADWVIATVEDDGPGVPAEIQERIFDPFFTTKTVGKGTGLGLGLALQIVSNHGGDISVESRPGEGSQFHVRFPRKRPERDADESA